MLGEQGRSGNTSADVGDISSYESGTTLFGYGTTQLNIASYNAVDLNAEYRGLGNWKFALGVVNPFNRQPPYDSGALLFLSSPSGPFDPTTYDDLARMVDLRVTYKFSPTKRSHEDKTPGRGPLRSLVIRRRAPRYLHLMCGYKSILAAAIMGTSPHCYKTNRDAVCSAH
jgi:hypothetical protein